jgi:hypothetical protein
MFVMSIHESKRKDFEDLQIAIFFVSYGKFCLLHEGLRRGFERPSKLAFPLCYVICGWVSYVCLKGNPSKTSKLHSYTKWIRMFVMIIHESKMKRLWRFSNCNFFFCWLWKVLLLHEGLKEKLSKIFKLHFFLLIMKSFVVACSLRRGF